MTTGCTRQAKRRGPPNLHSLHEAHATNSAVENRIYEVVSTSMGNFVNRRYGNAATVAFDSDRGTHGERLTAMIDAMRFEVLPRDETFGAPFALVRLRAQRDRTNKNKNVVIVSHNGGVRALTRSEVWLRQWMSSFVCVW